MMFVDCLREAIGNKDLVVEFNRLWGTQLGADRRPPIVRMVDDATGYQVGQEDMEKFVDFVYEFVWLPLMQKGEGGFDGTDQH
jgi:hypothetical protein